MYIILNWVHRTSSGVLKRVGINVRYADLDDVPTFVPVIDKNKKAIFIETIGNSQLNSPDFKKFTDLAKNLNFDWKYIILTVKV